MEFPHFPGDDFPSLEVGASYVNNFDYTRWGKSTGLRLCTVNYDASYKHVVDWQSASQRDAYFNNLTSSYYSQLKEPVRLEAFGRMDGRAHRVKVPIPFDVASRYNYLQVTLTRATSGGAPLNYETSDGVRTWYFFIREATYRAPSATELELELDVWTSWRPFIEVTGYMLERGHAAVNGAPSPEEFLVAPCYNNDYLLTPDVEITDSGEMKIAKPLHFAGEKFYCFTLPYTASQLQDLTPTGSQSGNFTDPEYFNTGVRNGYQKGVNGYEWNVSNSDYSTTPAINPQALPVGSDGAPQFYVYGVKAQDAPVFFTELRNKNLNVMRDIGAVFVVNRNWVFESDDFEMYGKTVYCLEPNPNISNFESISFTEADFNYPDEYRRFTKLYTSPYCKVTVSDNAGNIHNLNVQDLTGATGLRVRAVIGSGVFKTLAQITGLNANNAVSYTWQNVKGSNVTSNMSYSQIDAFLFENDIPTYQLSISAQRNWDIDNYSNALGARENALTSYKNSAASSNNAYENTVDGSQNTYDNALLSATTDNTNTKNAATTTNTNAKASANASYQNAEDTANAGFANAKSSADTTKINALMQNDTANANAVASANTARTNSEQAALIGEINAVAAANAAYANAERAANTSKTNTDAASNTANTNERAAASTAYGNTTRSNQAATDNTALQVTMSAANQASINSYGTLFLQKNNANETTLVGQQNDLQAELTYIENNKAALTTLVNSITQTGLGIASGNPSTMLSNASSAQAGQYATMIAMNASNEQRDALRSYRNLSNSTVHGNSNQLNQSKIEVADLINNRGNFTNTQTTANTVNASNTNALNARNTAFNNADRTKNTTQANATNSKNTAITNADNTRDISIETAERNRTLAIANADRTKSTAITNANRTKDTNETTIGLTHTASIENATRTQTTSINTADRTRDIAIANADRSRSLTNANADRSKTTAETIAGNNFSLAVNNAAYTRGTQIENAKRSLETAQDVYMYSRNNARLQKIVNLTEASGDVTRQVLGLEGYTARLSTPKQDNVRRLGDYFARYGYAVNQWFTGDILQKMKHFTYLKCSDVMLHNRGADSHAIDTVRGIMEEGVTVWSDAEKIGATSLYDNWR